ncbi:hypothetical protein RYX36_014691 [Vicia faba]
MSCSLYLVFEYMAHDLAGLATNHAIKFTEPQVEIGWGGKMHEDAICIFEMELSKDMDEFADDDEKYYSSMVWSQGIVGLEIFPFSHICLPFSASLIELMP